MGEVVNLRRYRKAKEKAEAERRANENRAKHGRPKGERQGVKARETLADRQLEAHRRDKADDAAGDDGGGDEPAA